MIVKTSKDLFFYYRKLLMAVLSRNRAVTPKRARVLKERTVDYIPATGFVKGCRASFPHWYLHYSEFGGVL